MHYRIYLLASDEHIRHGYDVDCCTDADAFAEIAGVIGGFPAAEPRRNPPRSGLVDP